MEIVVLLGFLLFAAFGGLLAYLLSTPAQASPPARLSPFVLLPVTDASPSTRAFLELYASQVAWMDSSVLQCVVLVHPENAEIAALCGEIARQYDFFTCMTLTQAQDLLKERVDFSECLEKKSESGCISS